MGSRWWRTRYLGICPVACGHLVSSRCVVFSSSSIDRHQPGASGSERQSGVSRVDEPANPTPPMDEERRCSHSICPERVNLRVLFPQKSTFLQLFSLPGGSLIESREILWVYQTGCEFLCNGMRGNAGGGARRRACRRLQSVLRWGKDDAPLGICKLDLSRYCSFSVSCRILYLEQLHRLAGISNLTGVLRIPCT